jgi:hypothetical protein
MVTHRSYRLAAALLGCALAWPATAAMFTVGSEPDCTFASLQEAINALPTSGTHEIRLRTGEYPQQALQIPHRSVTIIGGFERCGDPTPTGANSVLDGHGGAQAPVLTAFGFPIAVRLERLTIRRGDAPAGWHAGGVFFEGAGILSLRRTTVSNNSGGHGGGITVRAVGGAATLVLQEDSLVLNNVALHDGGGIQLWGGVGHRATLRAVHANSLIAFNEAANGLGGGIALLGDARAFIGSGGLVDTGIGVVYGNFALNGGGIAAAPAGNAEPDVVVHLFTTDAARPVRVHDNQAADAGGGLFLQNLHGGSIALCAQDFRIDGNVAAQGSAIEATLRNLTAHSASVHLNAAGLASDCPSPDSLGFAAVACAPGTACGSIDGHRNALPNGTAVLGNTVTVGQGGQFNARRVAFRDNRGNAVLGLRFGTGENPPQRTRAVLQNCLFADNVLDSTVLFTEVDSDLVMEHCTLTSNDIGGGHVLRNGGRLHLSRSVLFHPGKTTLLNEGSLLGSDHLLTSEAASLGGASQSIVQADPQFWDAAHGDYRLHPGSPAVDFTESSLAGVGGSDLDGRPREVDLAIRPDRFGPRDLGAYERQALLPLVRNGDFPVDLRSWDVVTPGTATWLEQGVDAGAVLISQIAPTGGLVPGLRQCIPLPGPGLYALNAHALAPGTGINRDIPVLFWRYRANSATCTGASTAEGELVLPRSGSFATAPIPARFASGAEWTRNATLEVTLAVRDGDLVGTNAVRAQFDRVVLAPAHDDAFFTDGFEMP